MKFNISVISLFLLASCNAKLMEERFNWKEVIWPKCTCEEKQVEKKVHFGPGPGDTEKKDSEDEEGWFNWF